MPWSISYCFFFKCALLCFFLLPRFITILRGTCIYLLRWGDSIWPTSVANNRKGRAHAPGMYIFMNSVVHSGYHLQNKVVLKGNHLLACYFVSDDKDAVSCNRLSSNWAFPCCNSFVQVHSIIFDILLISSLNK